MRVGRHERVAQGAQQIVGDAADVVALRQQFVDADERAGDVIAGDRFEHRQPEIEGCPTQRGLDRGRVERSRPDGERLIQQREGIPGRARGPAHDEIEDLGVGLDALAAEDVDEVAGELLGRQQRELEVLRARADGRQHLVRVGGGEHEHDMGRRLLERLQQRVRRRGREHVDLVDDVHLAARVRPEPEVHALDEIAHRLDAVVRRRVELDEVEERTVGDRHAVLALATRLAVGAEIEAVQRPGQQARRRRLPGTARSGEEVRMPDVIVDDRVAQRGGDMVLADQLAEALRSVLPVQAGHGLTVPATNRLFVWSGGSPAARPGDPAAPRSFR